ncbi:MAG TPA: ABC-2 family transporter protein [Candidatus Faecaligallichristensenella faecipullorum]|nr:ABC-2 family transporter protein [Candidatus Faecaligallichristensenella faecipullorum]
MRPYLALWRARFLTLLQYRTAAFAGICTQLLFGVVRVMALYAFYQFSDSPQSMSFSQAASYIWIGQAMLAMLPWNIEQEIGQTVRTGQVAYELARPLDLYGMWYARCLALRTAPTLLKSIPQFLITALVMPPVYAMQWPEFPVVLGWLAATLGGLILSCAITMLLNISLFWSVSGEGIVRIVPMLINLLSGNIIPLPLFPDWLQPVLRYQPFSGVLDGPAQIFCGTMGMEQLPGLLLTQALWSALLILLGRLLIRRGVRRVTVAGG